MKQKETKKISFIQKLFKRKYLIASAIIILIAVFVRFYHFDMRWGVGNDDSRDIAIAQEALKRHELPMIGSFSSAGPFVFGPFFYWFIMGSYIILPVFVSPWIFINIVNIFTVIILMYCGKKIAGNNIALLVGLLAALSPQLVSRSMVLGQHTFISFFTSLMILFLLIFIEKRSLIFALAVGLCIGAGINFHYQAINLLIFIPALYFIPQNNQYKKILSIVISLAGVLLALSPLLIWDAQQQFASFRNILDYFLIGQYRLYVPNSWRLFIFKYFTNYWALVAGGYSIISFVTMLVVGLVTIFSIIKKKLSFKFLELFVPFYLLIILNRFYKGERSEGYLLYFLPFIILITGYAIYSLMQAGRFIVIRRFIAIGLFSVIILGNIIFVFKIMNYHTSVSMHEKIIDQLVKKYPHQKFKVYDYKGSISEYNQALGVLLSNRHLTAQDGMPIGVVCYLKCPTEKMIASYGDLYLADLSKDKTLKNKKLWVVVNPENMYDDLIGWSKRHELRSTFSLEQYLTDKLHF